MALAGNADTDQYFKRGNCNQHAVGMCLVLEKTRECKMEIMADGKLRTEATFQEGADAQRNVCNALKGVHLHLIRDEERGIICPENKHKGSRMDLGHACHKVMDELILYNEMCESHEEEQGWTAWAMSVGGGGGGGGGSVQGFQLRSCRSASTRKITKERERSLLSASATEHKRCNT